MLVDVQLFVEGLYLPPVFNLLKLVSSPPHTIISPPVHTAVWRFRASGVFTMLVSVQTSVTGLYLPPVFNTPKSLFPPQIIISLPVQTAV